MSFSPPLPPLLSPSLPPFLPPSLLSSLPPSLPPSLPSSLLSFLSLSVTPVTSSVSMELSSQKTGTVGQCLPLPHSSLLTSPFTPPLLPLPLAPHSSPLPLLLLPLTPLTPPYTRISICTEYMDGGSLDGYGSIPEPILGRIIVAVSTAINTTTTSTTITGLFVILSNINYNKTSMMTSFTTSTIITRIHVYKHCYLCLCVFQYLVYIL